MELIQLAVLVSTLLCSLVAGFVLAFAIVVMPGLTALGEREYLRSFKAMDRVIQNNQPLFMLMWVGSALALLVSTVLGFWHLEGLDRTLLTVACVVYLGGVQLPTILANIPLNNWLQSQGLDTLTEATVHEAAIRVQGRWVRWNTIRTVFAVLTTVLLLVVLSR